MKRRALSTVVGAVFFVIVMTSSIAYVSYSMDLIDSLARSVEIKQNQDIDRSNEEFKITKVAIDANKFNLTLKNTGNIPINVTRLWAENQTDSSWNHTKYQINKAVFPGQTVSNIGQNINLIALDSQSYSLKLITERGNSLNTQLLSPTDKAIKMNLFSTPASPLTTQNVTLIYVVTNNLTEGSVLKSLTPQMDPPSTTGSAIATPKGGPTPATVESLNPNESAFFEWTYEITGDDGDKITFNATVSNAKQGNYITDTVIIDSPPVSETQITELISIAQGVLQLNFTTFEFCEPAPDDCTSDSSAWTNAWDGKQGTEYLWRINMTNNGDEDLLVEEHTALFMLRAQTGGGGGLPRSFFLKADSTPSVEDPGAYTDHSKIIPKDGTAAVLYFGVTAAGSSNLQTTHPDDGIYAVTVLIFGHDDVNDNGSYDDPGDPPYSQNLPFIALRLV